METITLNKSIGRTRRETLGGREYIVAPLSMLVPGVLNGSRGPLLYPPELVNRNPAVWNHMPIVVYHPMEQGKPTSARDPFILNKQGVGFVFRSKENGRAEGWFDVENTKRVDPRVYDALVKNQPMELSTGLFTKNAKASPGSSFRGKDYVEVVRDFTPDHLAILPDQKGACSMKDGCGMLINKENEPTALDKALQIVENGSPNQPRDARGRWSGGGGGASGGKGSSKTHGGATAGAAADSHETVKQMQKPGNTTNLANALTKAKEMTGYMNKSDRKSDEKYFKSEHKKADKEIADAKSALSSALAKQGSVKQLETQLSQIDQRIAELRAKKKPTQNSEGSQFGKPHNTVKEKPNMAKQRQVQNEEVELTDEDREELIDMIVDNCACEEASDRETLNNLSDKTLSQIAINAVPPQFMKGKGKKKVVAEEEESDAEIEDEEEVPVKNQARKPVPKVPEKKAVVTVNKTREDAPHKLDPKTQFLVNYAEKKMQEEKDTLIEQLTANASEEDVEELTEVYNEMDIDRLEVMVKGLPKREKQEPVQNSRNQRGRSNLREEQTQNSKGGRNFTGAGGALPRSQARQVNNGQRKSKDDDGDDALAGPLETPTINYNEVAGYQNGSFIHRNNLGSMQIANN